MEVEPVRLSDLRKKETTIEQSSPLDFVAPSNQLDGIISNTSIEDRVDKVDNSLLSGTLAQRMQRLNDKKNTFELLNREYQNAEENLIKETQGRGITRLGRRSELVTRQRTLDAKRKKELADIEDLRGNIATANRLRSEAQKIARENLINSSDLELIKKELIDDLRDSASENEIAALEKMSGKDLAYSILNADYEQLTPRQKEFYDEYTFRREEIKEENTQNDILDFALGDFVRKEKGDDDVSLSELIGEDDVTAETLLQNRVKQEVKDTNKKREDIKSKFN